MTAKKIYRFSVGIILLSFLIYFPFLTNIKQYLSIPNEIITFQSDDPLSFPDLGDDYQVSVTDGYKILNNEGNIYPSESGNQIFL